MKKKLYFKKYIFLKTILRVIMIMILLLPSCKVVKLNDKITKKDDASKKGFDIYFENENFNADKFIGDIWDSKVMPYMLEKAKDAAVVLTAISGDQQNGGKQYGANRRGEGQPWNFVVTGEGIIKKLDTTSRVGKLIIYIPSIKNKEIVIQIGPVIKGSSIRDSLDFISFDQFVNQLEFADISNSINKLVVEKVLSNIQFDQMVGKKIKFYGTFTMPDDPSIIIITPVKMEIK